MTNHETSPSDIVTDLNTLILAKISGAERIVNIRQDDDWDLPAEITLGGRLYGYDPVHSVAVELKGYVNKERGPIFGIRICGDNNCLEEYVVSKDNVYNFGKLRDSDNAEIQNLFMWVERTKWNEYHTQMFADQDRSIRNY